MFTATCDNRPTLRELKEWMIQKAPTNKAAQTLFNQINRKHLRRSQSIAGNAEIQNLASLLGDKAYEFERWLRSPSSNVAGLAIEGGNDDDDDSLMKDTQKLFDDDDSDDGGASPPPPTKKRIRLSREEFSEGAPDPLAIDPKVKTDHKKGMKFVTNMSVALTGARKGDILRGNKDNNITKGAIIQIIRGEVHPEMGRLKHVLKYKDLRKTYFAKLGASPHFRDRPHSLPYLEKWLRKNIIKTQPRIGSDGVTFRLIRPGKGKLFSGLGGTAEGQQAMMDLMSAKDPWDAAGFDARLKKAGVARNLFLLAEYWQTVDRFQTVPLPKAVTKYSATDVLIDVEHGCLREAGYLRTVDPEAGYMVYEIPSIPSGRPVVKARHLRMPWSAPSDSETRTVLLLARRATKDPKQMVKDLLQNRVKDSASIELCLRSFVRSNGGLKSLIQKIIRVWPRQVSLPPSSTEAHTTQTFMAEDVLAVACLHLARNPGNFNSNIQRFTTGIEAFAKRLAVTIGEDSYLPADDAGNCPLLSLLGGAFLIQYTDSVWHPCEDLLWRWVMYAQRAAASPMAVDYVHVAQPGHSRQQLKGWLQRAKAKRADASVPGLLLPPCRLSGRADQPPMEVCSALLDLCGSMNGDYGLMRWQTYNSPLPRARLLRARGEQGPTYTMPLEHAVDFHFASTLAYFFNPEFVVECSPMSMKSNGYETDKCKPFGELYANVIWKHSSSLNPRRSPGLDVSEMERTDPYLVATRQAQREYLQTMLKLTHVAQRPPLPEKDTFTYTLNDAWLSGMVGTLRRSVPRTRKQAIPVLVTLSVVDPYKLHTVRDPLTKLKGKPTTEEINTLEAQIRKTELRGSGLLLNQVHPPDPRLRGCRLTQSHEGKYEVSGFNGRNGAVLWDEIKRLEYSFDTTAPAVAPVEERYVERRSRAGLALRGTRLNVVEPALRKQLRVWVRRTAARGDNPRFQMEVLRRSLMFLGGYNTTIKLRAVGRDGAGTDLSVALCDVGVFHFLLGLCSLCPAVIVPSARSPAAFQIHCCPVLWSLRDVVANEIAALEAEDSVRAAGTQWPTIKEQAGRVLRDYQQDVVDDLVANRRYGLRGNFIWIAPGMGKTKAVLTYMSRLRETDDLPDYVIYTLPQSAIASVKKEIEKMNLRTHLIVPTKQHEKHMRLNGTVDKMGNTTSSSCNPMPHRISLIEHDHLRKCVKGLSGFASRSLFIIDEVHKALNTTQRTSASLQMAAMSREFVAFTGTAVVDDKTEKLIGWLERIVPFAVNTKNFWAAANSIVMKEYDLGIRRTTISYQVDFSDRDREAEFTRNAPPYLHGRKQNPTVKNLQAAYQAALSECTVQMADLTVKILHQVDTPEIPTTGQYTVGVVLQDPASEDAANSVRQVMGKAAGVVAVDLVKRMGETKIVARIRTRGEQQKLYNHLEGLGEDALPPIAYMYHLRPNVMLVANNYSHQQELRKELRELGVPDRDIYDVGPKQKPKYLTAQDVRAGKESDYRVVLVSKHQNTGYSNTHCTHMITSLYPSNNADREQLRGRIHRVSQEADTIFYIEVCCSPIMDALRERHGMAQNLQKALLDMMKQYKVKQGRKSRLKNKKQKKKKKCKHYKLNSIV